MVNKSMRCAAEAAQKALARLNAAASGSALESVVDDSSSATASSQPAAPDAAGARGNNPRADDGSELELIYSGESDGESDSKKNTNPPGSPEADPDRARLTGSGERGQRCPRSSDQAIRVMNPHHTLRSAVVVTHQCVPKRGATQEIQLLLVSALMLTPRKSAETAMSCDTLHKWNLLGCHHPRSWIGGHG